MSAVAAGLAPALEALRARLGERLSTAAAVREHHGRDESYHRPAPPDAVAFVRSTEEAAAVVAVCARHRVPVIPFGAGTSLEGHVAALHGGVSLDLSAMDRILEVSPEDLDCRVEAGVTRRQLDRAIADHGLFFPIDPGADASLGGMAATGASGTNAVRYGTMRENVRGLTVVLADGRVIRTGGRARKSSSGYDLTRLFIGSEGTLGVITELQLALRGLPEALAVAVVAFPSLAAAVEMASETIRSGVPVARIELLDALQMAAVNRHAGLDHRQAPTLFIELAGGPAAVAEQTELVAEVAREHGAEDLRWGHDQEARARLWRARHEAYYAALALRPGSSGWSTDVCVPISRLAACIEATREDIEAAGLLAPILGHVGDGNFHVIFLLGPEAEDGGDELGRARAVNEAMVRRALEMGGTASGEHGVGYGKIDLVEAEHGADAIGVMRAIKRALDPDGIMNPGKVFRS